MMMTEKQERFEVVNALLNAIPRDGDHNMELWNTADPNRTNLREKLVMKLLQGFSVYIVLMGKNYAYETKIESRFAHSVFPLSPCLHFF